MGILTEIEFEVVSPFYSVVAPWPTILTPPESTDAIEGQAVQLSCKISGFPNATLVQWTRNSSIIDISDSNKYSTRRHMVNATEDVFVETLQFAVSPDLEGHYACCVSVLREEENAPTGSGWIDESDCSTYGTITIDHGMSGLQYMNELRPLYCHHTCS